MADHRLTKNVSYRNMHIYLYITGLACADEWLLRGYDTSISRETRSFYGSCARDRLLLIIYVDNLTISVIIINNFFQISWLKATCETMQSSSDAEIWYKNIIQIYISYSHSPYLCIKKESYILRHVISDRSYPAIFWQSIAFFLITAIC